MKRTMFSYLTLFLLCLFASCSDDDSPEKESGSELFQKIEFIGGSDYSSLAFDSKGGDKSVRFKASESWTIKVEGMDASDKWLSVSPQSGGPGESTIVLKASQNEQKEERKSRVSIATVHDKKVIEVSQMQKDALVIAKSSYTVDDEGEDIEIEVGHNVDFDVSIDVDWIKQTSSRSYQTEKLVFKVAENPDYDNREGKITFTSKDGSIKQEVKVYQTTGNALVVSPTQNSFDCNEHTFDIEIKANVEFIVTDPDADWLHCVEGRALTSHTLHYKIDANDGVENREAKIQVKSKDGSMTETVSVLQMQKDALVVAQSEYSLSEKGGKIEVKVGHNVDFDVSIDVDWIVRKENNSRAFVTDKLVFEVSENTGEDNRDGKITFTSKDRKLIQKVIIKQKAKFNDSVYEIAEENLRGWDKGYIYGDNIYFTTKIDTSTNQIIGYVSSFTDTNELGFIIISENDVDNRILQICTSEKTYYFSYDENGEQRIHSVTDNGEITPLRHSKQKNVNNLTRSFDQQKTSQKIFGQIYDFCQNNADEFAASDVPFLRKVAEDLRSLPENMAKDGAIKALVKLTGKRNLPFVFDIIDKINDYNRENNIFGNCSFNIVGVEGDENGRTLSTNLLNVSDLPDLGEVEKNFSYGIICRFTGQQNDFHRPTIYWNDYKWEYTLGQGNITKSLPEMQMGWYAFRTYITRIGVTKYCDYYTYFCPDLDELPTYSVDNIQCSYLGNNKVRVIFDCTFNPLTYENIRIQGMKLKTQDGRELATLGKNEGMGTNQIHVEKEINKDLFQEFDYKNFTAIFPISAEYFYVPLSNAPTYYKELPIKNIIYDQKPQAFTGNSSSVTESSATVECSYKDFLFWDGVCGVEYSGSGITSSFTCNLNDDGDYKYAIDGLKDGETYTYRAFISCKGNKIYGDTKQFITKKKDDGPTPGLWIDLGLPSGIKWASHNVGATSPEGYGDYFAWGETSPKADYSDETYRFSIFDKDGNWIGFKKLGKISGNPSYDAATANWGVPARMPTFEECKELVNNCIYKWTTYNGVEGGLLVSRINGNSIFLPFAGYRIYTQFDNTYNTGHYLSSTATYELCDFCDLDDFCALGFLFDSFDIVLDNMGGRCYGNSVRPVRN